MPSQSSLLKALVLVVVVAITAVVGAHYLGSREGRGSTPTPGPSAVADTTPTPTLQAVSPSAPSPTATPVPPSPVPPGPSTTIGLDRVGLVAGGSAVELTFVSDGTGLVSAQVETASAPVNLCLRPQGGTASCKVWTSGNLSLASHGTHETWVASIGAASSAAIATVAVTFPSAAPSVGLTGLHFGGTDYPGLDGIDLRFRPQRSGTAALRASWGLAYRYAFSVRDVTSGSTSVSSLATGTSLAQTFAVAPPDTWRVTLTNHSRVPPDAMLAVDFSWP